MAREWLLLLGVALATLTFALVVIALSAQRGLAVSRQQHAEAHHRQARAEARDRQALMDRYSSLLEAPEEAGEGNEQRREERLNPFADILGTRKEAGEAVKAASLDLWRAERAASPAAILDEALGPATWVLALVVYLAIMILRSIVWSVRALRRS